MAAEFQARLQRGEIISDKLMELEKQIEGRVQIERVGSYFMGCGILPCGNW